MIAWIKNQLRTRTPGEMLQAQLAEAERMRVVYRATEEEAGAYVWMLDNRITRIKGELAQINTTTASQENQ